MGWHASDRRLNLSCETSFLRESRIVSLGDHIWKIFSKKGCAGRLGHPPGFLDLQVQWFRRQGGLES